MPATTRPQPAPDAAPDAVAVAQAALADIRQYLYGVGESDLCRARLLSAADIIGKGLAQMELDRTRARAAHAAMVKALAAADEMAERLDFANSLLRQFYSDQLPTAYVPSRTAEIVAAYRAARRQS